MSTQFKNLFVNPEDVFSTPKKAAEEVLNKMHELKTAHNLSGDAEDWYRDFLRYLTQGKIRTATKQKSGTWKVDTRVKEGILVGFRLGVMTKMGENFADKHTLPLRPVDLSSQVRIAPGGTSVRAGAYLGPNVIIMPPAYVNVGAYVGEGTLLDSQSLIGSCAQIGARCHISGGALVGGVLEPVNKTPCIVEDDVLMGINSSIAEGVIVQEKVVMGAGVQITASTPVYDLVRGKIYDAKNGPLTIPARAVVVPGARLIAKNEFAKKHGLSLAAPVIPKYRDEKTAAATALEQALR